MFTAVIAVIRGWSSSAVRMEDMLEELGLVVTLAPTTTLTVIALMAGVVALTPLVHARRLRRLDVPSALRVMSELAGTILDGGTHIAPGRLLRA